MIEGYLTVKEVADKWGVTPKRVQVLCIAGRIEGASKFGREWATPSDVAIPTARELIRESIGTGEKIERRITVKREKLIDDDFRRIFDTDRIVNYLSES